MCVLVMWTKGDMVTTKITDRIIENGRNEESYLKLSNKNRNYANNEKYKVKVDALMDPSQTCRQTRGRLVQGYTTNQW